MCRSPIAAFAKSGQRLVAQCFRARIYQKGKEHLTKPSDLVEEDKGAVESNECLVHVGAAFVTHRQAAKAVELGERLLHNPAVPAEPFAAVHAVLDDAECN